MSCSNDDTFGIRIQFWKSLQGIRDDTRHPQASIPVDSGRIDPGVDHCTYHSSNNI